MSTTLSLFRSLADLRVRHATFRPAPKRSPCQGWAGSAPGSRISELSEPLIAGGQAASRPVLRVCEPSNRNPSCQTGLNSGWDFMPARHTGPPGFETPKTQPHSYPAGADRPAGSRFRSSLSSVSGRGHRQVLAPPPLLAPVSPCTLAAPMASTRLGFVAVEHARARGARARRFSVASSAGRHEPARPQNPDAADASRAPRSRPRGLRARRSAPRSAPAGGWTPVRLGTPARVFSTPEDLMAHFADALASTPETRTSTTASCSTRFARIPTRGRRSAPAPRACRSDSTLQALRQFRRRPRGRHLRRFQLPQVRRGALPRICQASEDVHVDPRRPSRKLARRFQTLDVRLHRQSRRCAQRAHLQTSLRRVSPRHRPRARGRARPHPRAARLFDSVRMSPRRRARSESSRPTRPVSRPSWTSPSRCARTIADSTIAAWRASRTPSRASRRRALGATETRLGSTPARRVRAHRRVGASRRAGCGVHVVAGDV